MTKKELLGVDVLSMLCDAVDIPYSIEIKRTSYNIQMKSCTVTVGSKKFNCRGDESILSALTER